MANDQSQSGLSNISMDSELGRLVVEQNLATTEEVQKCLEIQKQGSDPMQRSLAQLLVAHGVVTARQIDRIKKTIEPVRPSQQIPNYQILGKLGSGAMATVFKAKQLSLDRDVAIKVLPRRLSENPEYVTRFYKEGKAAAQLNHANIVQAIDVGEAAGYHYFVMEYVEGHTVYDELAKGKIFTEKEAIDVILQMARALKHAHERGFIHRDVKPKNIMITPDRVAKLADMGLAREARDAEAAKAEKGRAFGTPYYISPEQIRGDISVDFRADIYSLGATFYHMVTGKVPFEAATPAAVMHKHLRDPLVPPDHLNTSLSSGVGEIIEVMMAKKREQRYSQVDDLIHDLEAVQHGEPPLHARRVIKADVLSALTEAAPGAAEDPMADTSYVEPPASGRQMVYLILLAAALGISVLLNIILLVK